MRQFGNSATEFQRGGALAWLLALLVAAGAVAGWWWLNPASAPAWAKERLPWLFVTETVLYRWQDEAGDWHVSDRPPEDRPYEQVRYRSDANVVPPEG